MYLLRVSPELPLIIHSEIFIEVLSCHEFQHFVSEYLLILSESITYVIFEIVLQESHEVKQPHISELVSCFIHIALCFAFGEVSLEFVVDVDVQLNVAISERSFYINPEQLAQ